MPPEGLCNPKSKIQNGVMSAFLRPIKKLFGGYPTLGTSYIFQKKIIKEWVKTANFNLG